MKKIKVGLFGASGRMGKEITAIISESKNLEIFLPVGSNDKVDAKKAGQVNVWIDFSTPDSLSSVLKIAILNQTAVVCGTTGLKAKHKKMLTAAARDIPILWSSNMSLGVAVLNEALKVFSNLNNYDFQIEEIHHIHKKDKPSGTAITLQENLQKIIGKKLSPPVAIRGGGVFGIHKVFAMSEEEVITFEHTALNRRVFAKGALRMATWLHNKKPGLYAVSDCLFGK